MFGSRGENAMIGRLLILATTVALALCGACRAEDYPDRPVHIVVGYGAGGPDTTARLLAAQLTAQTGKRFLVDNKPGSSGVIGAEFVAKSRPDGYTLLVAASSLASLPSLQKKPPFDVLKSFAPISQVAEPEASFLVVAPALPVRTLKEFVAYARDPKNRVAYASTGIGTGAHLRMALFASANRLTMLHAPFKGGGEALVSVMGNQTQALFLPTTQALPLIKAGKVRALAYDYAARNPLAPEVPTMAEAGAAPTQFGAGWHGLLAPAGVPRPVQLWLEAQARKAVATPSVREKLESLGLVPVGGSSEAFAAVLATSVREQAAAARAAGIKPQ
jgi:tripartite-type tricarboxylate transporter receptor subunit TctC